MISRLIDWCAANRFLVFTEAGRIVGALSFEIAGNCVTVTRLVVSPGRFRRGIASALLTALETRLPAASTLPAFEGSSARAALCNRYRQMRKATPLPRRDAQAARLPPTCLAVTPDQERAALHSVILREIRTKTLS